MWIIKSSSSCVRSNIESVFNELSQRFLNGCIKEHLTPCLCNLLTPILISFMHNVNGTLLIRGLLMFSVSSARNIRKLHPRAPWNVWRTNVQQPAWRSSSFRRAKLFWTSSASTKPGKWKAPNTIRRSFHHVSVSWLRFILISSWLHENISATCTPACANKGRCTAPNKCQCSSDFQGPTCKEKACKQQPAATRNSKRVCKGPWVENLSFESF